MRSWITAISLPIFLLLIGTSFCEVIPLSEIRSVVSYHLEINENFAEKFKISDEKNVSFTKKEIIPFHDKSGKTLFFVTTLKPRGYIVITPEKFLRPVIAYSFESDFVFDESQNNVLLDMLEQDISMRINAFNILPQENHEENRNLWRQYLAGDKEYAAYIASTETWGPWIDTRWNQGYPYNLMCPIDPESHDRCITGCTATSMAQIINYWEYPPFVSFPEDDCYWSVYTEPSIWIDAPSASVDTFDYDYTYYHHPSDSTTAKLMFAAGVSVFSNYSSYATGANVIGEYYNKTWGYKNSTDMDGDEPLFYDVLADDMINNRPAHMAIYQSDWTGGHSIICDGYRDSGEYHLNFGWSGSTDGWYFLPLGMPVGYSIISYAVMNIEPEPRPDAPSTCDSAFIIYPAETIATWKDAIYPRGEGDWFQFQAATESTYVFYTTGKINTYAEIYASCGDEPIFSNDDGFSDENFHIEFKPPVDGLYFIKISGNNPETFGFYSMHYYTVQGPYIEIIIPNGGEIFDDNSAAIIRWNKGGIPNFTWVKLEYSFTGSDGLWLSIIDSTSNPGMFLWCIPDVPENIDNCFIRISSVKYVDVFDISDEAISIINSSSVKENILPTTISLDVFPNPFNSGVMCQISGVNEYGVAIEIFDLQGKRIADYERFLVNSIDDDSSENQHHKMSPTSCIFIWRPDEQTLSGIYLVKATTENGKIASKMVVYLK